MTLCIASNQHLEVYLPKKFVEEAENLGKAGEAVRTGMV